MEKLMSIIDPKLATPCMWLPEKTMRDLGDSCFHSLQVCRSMVSHNGKNALSLSAGVSQCFFIMVKMYFIL